MMMNEQLHIAVLPWLAAGHLNPFVELSTRLSLLGHRVSFLSTPSNLLRLPPPLHPVPLHPSVPLDVACTADVSTAPGAEALRVNIRLAYDSLAGPLSAFLSTASPPVDWLLCDYGSYWAPPLARSSGARSAFVSLFNAAFDFFIGPPDNMLRCGGGRGRTTEDLTKPPEWAALSSPTSVVVYKPYEARKLGELGVFVADDTGVSEAYRLAKTIEGCDAVAIRSCVELEEEWLQFLPKIYNKPVIPLGHFPPNPRDSNSCGDIEWAQAFEWLNKQSHGSVVYVAFGSEVRLAKKEIHKIAHGLDRSGLPFVWALRKPDGEGEEEVLPEGFEARVRARGLVCHGWVPQVRFLGHPAVGGFLTHCGWNSLVEGLMFGRALILMPMIYDQALNARVLAQKGLGMEVPRDDEDGTFDEDGVSKTLRLVMVSEEGEPYRAKTKKLKSVLGNKEVQNSYISRFVGYLKAHKSGPHSIRADSGPHN